MTDEELLGRLIAGCTADGIVPDSVLIETGDHPAQRRIEYTATNYRPIRTLKYAYEITIRAIMARPNQQLRVYLNFFPLEWPGETVLETDPLGK